MGNVAGVQSAQGVNQGIDAQTRLLALSCALSAIDLVSDLHRMSYMSAPFRPHCMFPHMYTFASPIVIRVRIIGLGNSSDVKVETPPQPDEKTEPETQISCAEPEALVSDEKELDAEMQPVENKEEITVSEPR